MPPLSAAANLAPEGSKRAERVVIDLTHSDNESEDGKPATSKPARPLSSAPAHVDRLPLSDIRPLESTSTQSKPLRTPAILPPSHSSSTTTYSADVAHPAKRRKTETPPATTQNATRILPPKPQYRRSSSAVITPAQIPIKPKSIVPPPRTIIDGAHRQGLRVSPDTRIQKPQASIPRKSGVERQITDFVKTSVAKHKNLSKDVRKSVVLRATKELLDPSVFVELTSEHVSDNYLRSLKDKANHITNKLVQQNAITQDDSSVHSESEVDVTFEPAVRNARRYSSSPTTSLDHKDDGGTSTAIVPSERKKPTPLTVRTSTRVIPQKNPISSQRPRRQERSLVPESIQNRKSSPNVATTPSDPPSVSQQRRPYLKYDDRAALRNGLESADIYLSKQGRRKLASIAIHVDFCLEEVKIIYIVALKVKGKDVKEIELSPDLPSKLVSILAGDSQQTILRIRRDLRVALEANETYSDNGIRLLRARDDTAIPNFLHDVLANKLESHQRSMKVQVQTKSKRSLRLSHLLLQREISGQAPFRICSGKESFRSQLTGMLEDQLVRKSHWTDCCGDIATITWASETAFLCGATAHSDFHNMQYNKPGNLVVGSTTLDTLRALSNHRIVRPSVAHEQNAENALQSMRNTQDPWLYTSVVSTAFSKKSKLAFSGSFDKTVKVWSVPDDGSMMQLRGAWYHDAKVNFVVTSEHHEMVATACDVNIDAVRVYWVDDQDISQSEYDKYCSNRTQGNGQLDGGDGKNEKWAYFPATIQWGSSWVVSHLLLVGYSPRSLTEDDFDIPEDKRNTGELCLWNAKDNTKAIINSASMQNVFEVIWHPTQPIFLAATSPAGNFETFKTKTQIRIYGPTSNEAWTQLKVLDCPALDINELTIMPNSVLQSYVTASCTDGNTYVYDTAQGDKPIHILRHGESLDNPLHDLPRDIADTGVKFAAWGQNKSRFYTGASDGKVKAWDVTAPPGHAFVRDVLAVSAGVSSAAFSPDFSQLVVGDASGKVHLLGIDDSDIEESLPLKKDLTFANTKRALRTGGVLPSSIKRPKVVIPHAEPPPPKNSQNFQQEDLERTGPEIARELVDSGAITINPDPAIGAVQGENYASTVYFRYEAHEDFDGTAPLLPEWQVKQKSHMQSLQSESSIPTLPHVKSSDPQQHAANCALDLDLEKLSLDTTKQLYQDRVEWDWQYNFDNEMFPGKKFPLFKESSQDKKARKSRDRDRNRYSHGQGGLSMSRNPHLNAQLERDSNFNIMELD